MSITSQKVTFAEGTNSTRILTDSITVDSLTPFQTSGRYCDLFTGSHRSFGKVALKRLRITDDSYGDQHVRRFEQEAKTWKSLKHPNLLPFYGLVDTEEHLYLMSPWMNFGPLLGYLESHPECDRRKFIEQAASALAYLHRRGIVHGDVKGSNILVSGDVQALLCDFGLATTVDEVTESSMQVSKNTRWLSPELMKGTSRGFASDVYAFGITISELLSGSIPFPKCRTTEAIKFAVLHNGIRPPPIPAMSPSGTSYEPLWNIAQWCWQVDESYRPEMARVVERLSALTTVKKASLPRTNSALTMEDLLSEAHREENVEVGMVVA